MPMSQGNFSSGPIGMALKAWVQVNASGAVVKSFNVASATFSGGVYTINFTTNMATTNYVINSTTDGNVKSDVKTVANMKYNIFDMVGNVQQRDHHIAIYE